MTYWRKLGEAISQLGSALVGKDPNLTLSYYVGRAQHYQRWWGLILAPIINWIFRNRNHCKNAFLNRV